MSGGCAGGGWGCYARRMANRGVLALEPGKRCLIAAASGLEAAAILRGLGATGLAELSPQWLSISVSDRFDVVVTGVGKANAAGGMARAFDAQRHALVLSVGIGGMLADRLAIGLCVLGQHSVYADEGVPLPDGGFQDVASLGFPPNAGTGAAASIGVPATALVAGALRGVCDAEGVIATVSECSGTDSRAAEVRRRTGAEVEAMEGAAVGFSVQRLGEGRCGFAEVRVVSNTTGDRPKQRWDIRTALARLETFASTL